MVERILSKLSVWKIVENLLVRFLLDEKMPVISLRYPSFSVVRI